MQWFSCLMIASSVILGEGPIPGSVLEWGGDPSRGCLVNRTVGADPRAPVDPSRPTVVVVHGVNPMHPFVHFTLAERYGESIGRRLGEAVNVLGWEWNAATLPSLRPWVNDRHAVEQGRRLAVALGSAGVDPTSLHLIGHSTGCVVAASASREFAGRGVRVGRLTLLDPVVTQHRLIFQELGAATTASSLEHHWAAGPSGFGRPAPYLGVSNRRFDGPGGLRGLLRPSRLDHLNVVRWHLQSAGP